MTVSNIWEKDGYVMRSAQAADVERYYAENFSPLDKEVARLTGCKEVFSREEVESCLLKSIWATDPGRFVII